MGAATTVGPRAGVLTRVGESRALAPCILAPKGGEWCPLLPLPCRLPFLGPFDMVAPSHSWDNGRGRIPTRDTPRCARAQPPPRGRGFANLHKCGRNGRLGQGNARRMDSPPPTSCVEARGGFSLPFMVLGLEMAHDEGPSYSGQSVPVVLSL